MRIQIVEDSDRLEITDEHFNVDNYVNVHIRRKTEDGKVHELSMDVTIEELYTAAKAFFESRDRRRRADKLL